MYIQEIVRMLAEPYGAEDTAPWPLDSLSIGRTAWLATNGARCAATPIGPIPGPPPPCGIAKVLCKFNFALQVYFMDMTNGNVVCF